jgi:type I restriction enzyme S subunit
MFQRIDAEEQYGIEVITQKPLFHLFPEGRWISRKYLLNHSPKYVVPDETILIAKQGTLGEHELYCRCEFITGRRATARAYSDHCMRIVTLPEKIHPGFLFAFLRSRTGFRLLRGLSEGSKQQDLHWRTVPLLPIPRLEPTIENNIGNRVREAYTLRDSAIDKIIAARLLVEQAIEETP